jgi:hypothetical protein
MPRTPAAQLAECLVYEPVFLVNVLDGLFIENMPVGKFRHGPGLVLAPLPFFHFLSATGV